MRINIFILTLHFVVAGAGIVKAQIYNNPGGTISTCSGWFYDTGGSSSGYSAFENITTTFCSNAGNSIVFSGMGIWDISTLDYMSIYDGPDDTYPLIGSYTYLDFIPLLTSTGSCLTFNFVSGLLFGNAGWEGEFSCVGLPQPIELLSFTANPVQQTSDKYIVHCNWATASELNNDYFAIERSKDGINFEKIGTIHGAPGGNSSVVLQYKYDDEFPYTGISYYRLKQVDFNGQYEYSPVRIVYIGTLEIISIYPNPPVDGYIQYTVASETGSTVTVKVTDVLGREILSNTETIEAGVTTKKLSTATFASGSYLLRIVTKQQEKVQKQFMVK